MDGTTIERVKGLMPKKALDTDGDGYIAALIASVSAHAEAFLRRSLGTVERTVTLDWTCGRRRIMLPAYPVSASPAAVIKSDTWRVFGSDTVVDSSCYAIDLDRGVVFFDLWIPDEGFQTLRVTWTGGMGATPEALAESYPAVSQAIAMQVAHEYRRRARLDVASLSVGSQVIGAVGEVKLLDLVEQMLQPHRREGLLT